MKPPDKPNIRKYGGAWPPPKLDPSKFNASPVVLEPERPYGHTHLGRKNLEDMTTENEDTVISVLEGGGTLALAARAIGVDRRQLRNYSEANAAFMERIKAAKDLVDDAVEAALFQVAIGKSRTEGKGQIVAIIFWLKNRRPQQWRDVHDLTLRPGDGNESQFVLPGGQVLSPTSSGLSMARTHK